MTLIIVAIQIALPLALLAWLAFFPAATAVGWVAQAAGVALFILALALVAQWAVPAWWLPWVYAVLCVMAALLRIRSPWGGLLPTGLVGWAGLAVAAVLLVVGGWYGRLALAGRVLPEVEVIDIANPFGPGRYLLGHGGSNPLVNGHMRTLDETVERFRPWRGQSYALDFFGLGPWGLRAAGWRPADPAKYAIFGARLHVPCDGTVIAVENDMPDHEVPNEDDANRLGNHVILRCGDVEVVLAHLRRHSVEVAPGQSVTKGARLGEVGNSGASTEPHLHIHAQRPGTADEPISGDPLALRIDGRYLVRGDRISGRTW